MPPKSKKKKSKTSKSTIKEACKSSPFKVKPAHDLDAQAEVLQREWKFCSQRDALETQIKKKINLQAGIFLDNALCLGFGSLEQSPLTLLPGWPANKLERDDFENEAELSWDEELETRYRPVGRGKERNMTLYQLLVFETAIECLREKFPIETIRFQDPAFTKRDQEFLEQRGHTVIEWVDSSVPKAQYSIDPRLSEFLSPSTMCYCPYLDLPVTVQLLHAARPSLSLGTSLAGTTVQQNILRLESTKYLMNEYETIVLQYDFDPVAAFQGEHLGINFGFMWKADFGEKGVVERVTLRNHKEIEKERRRWEGIDKMLEIQRPGRSEKEARILIEEMRVREGLKEPAP